MIENVFTLMETRFGAPVALFVEILCIFADFRSNFLKKNVLGRNAEISDGNKNFILKKILLHLVTLKKSSP